MCHRLPYRLQVTSVICYHDICCCIRQLHAHLAIHHQTSDADTDQLTCSALALLQVRMVLRAGVQPDRIVYANACKRPKDIRAAASLGVDLTTFDTVSELRKLHQWHPRTAALLRIRADDPAARCQLGNKYGAEMAAVPALLQVGALVASTALT